MSKSQYYKYVVLALFSIFMIVLAVLCAVVDADGQTIPQIPQGCEILSPEEPYCISAISSAPAVKVWLPIVRK